MHIVVIGGTGLIGAKIVTMLALKGHTVLAAAPSTGVDARTGKGLLKALCGAEIVIDVADAPAFDDDTAMDFFETTGRNIASAAEAAGICHHVALSVVGTERLQDSGYFRAKLAQEKQIKKSSIPFTLIRATQFFEFLHRIAASATHGEEIRLPAARFQPIAARDVAAAIVEVALSAPANDTIELAGPEPFRMNQLVARVLARDGDRRTVIADPEARYLGLALTDRSLMPGSAARLGATHFDWWLANVARPEATELHVGGATR